MFYLSTCKLISHCPVVMRGLQDHLHDDSLQSSSRTFKLLNFLCTQYTSRSMFSKQDIIQLNLLFYLSCCCFDTKLLTNVNLRSSTPLSTSFVDITSLLQQVSPTTFSSANRDINPLLRGFLSLLFLSFSFFHGQPYSSLRQQCRK